MSIFPPDDYEFDTNTDIQNEFITRIKLQGTDDAIEWLLTFKEEQELSHPRVLKFEWENDKTTKYVFELSKNEEFSHPYILNCADTFCEIYNFEIGVKYFWRVNGGKVHHFFTKATAFRFIKLEGALNVRDLGGNKIKQGLLYRGSDIDLCYPLTNEGRQAFKDVLKIKTELDLRLEVDGARPCIISEGVQLVRLPYRPYKEIFEPQHKKRICDILEFLSCEENYPIYFHCLGGADRTGMIAIYLRALAGESDEMIHTDYELTGLSSYAYGIAEGIAKTGIRSRNSDYYKDFISMLEIYAPGEPLSKKIPAFLLECGIPQETLDKIIDIIT